MTAKAKPTREGPLIIPMKFDAAIEQALAVKPPSEGWAEYEKKLRKTRKRRQAKNAA
jgi:hypothetical protein